MSINIMENFTIQPTIHSVILDQSGTDKIPTSSYWYLKTGTEGQIDYIDSLY